MTLVQKDIKRVTIRPNGTEKQIRPVAEHLPALSEWNWTVDQSTTFGSRWQLSFGPDWTTISNWGVNNKYLYCGTCTVPYDLSTITNTSNIQINIWSSWGGIGKCARSTDWYCFITSASSTFYKYSVTTPFTFSWATQVQTATVSVDVARWFHVLWWWQYICGCNWLRWHMSTPYDLTTLQPTSAVNTTFITQEKADIFATQTWNEAYIAVYWDSTIKRLTFQTPFDFSTAVVEESHSLWYRPQWVWYAKDWQNEYLFIGEGYGTIRRYVKA
jgi:hypothetical protein